MKTSMMDQVANSSSSGAVPQASERIAPAREAEQASSLAEVIHHEPTVKQRQMKSKFWARYTPGPTPPSTTRIAQIIETKIITKWAQEPGFLPWFLNQDEGRESLEFLYQEWLGQAAKRLTSSNEPLGNKDFLAFGRIFAELANKFPTKNVEKFQDDDISKMGPEALRLFLSARGVGATMPGELPEVRTFAIKDEPVLDVSVDSMTALELKHPN